MAAEANVIERGAEPGPSGRPRARLPSLTLLSVVLGLLSIAAAVALPLAPVLVNRPVISWPVDPSAARPTMAMLTAYRPLSVDATFSCRTVVAASGRSPSTVLATTRPDSPTGMQVGLAISVENGELVAVSRGVVVARDTLGPAPCRYTLSGRGDEIVLSRDGRELGRGPMPDVDVLTTSVRELPGATSSDLSVRLVVDDGFATSPTTLKIALLVLLAVCGTGSVVLLAVMDRRRSPPAAGPRRPRWPPWPRGRWGLLALLIDGGVFVAMAAWTFIGPMTPDDGYYSAMATNAPFEGYVGNYYQLFNQGFTPFTWIYQALAWWQELVGTSPVLVRIPAVICGLLTWLCVRRLVVAVGRDADTGLAARSSARGALTSVAAGVAFLAWWMPFDLGVRPEPVTALATAAALLGVVLAAERSSLLLAGLAVGAASLGATTAPTGMVSLAPLLAGIPRLWPTLRGSGGRMSTVGRIACVLAPGGLGAAAAFGDGSWRDFMRAQHLLSGAQVPEGWQTEYKRWISLFESPFAARAAVLVTVVALLMFLILWAAGAARARPLPGRLVVTGTTMGLALLLLSPSPSKPWMHFGALAGVGAALLGLVAVEAPRAWRALTARPARAPLLVLGLVVVLVLGVAGSGVNSWWFTSLDDLPHADLPPQVWIFRFGQPLWWALGAVVLAVLFWLLARHRAPGWRAWSPVLALSVTVVVFLAANVAYMLGVFGLDAARSGESWSLAAQNLQDPTSQNCSVASWIDVADPQGPPLAVDPRAPAPPSTGTGFAVNGGWFEASAPPVPPAPGAVTWGSLVPAPRPGEPRETSTGTLTTPWWTLPAPAPDRTVTALVSGRTGGGNTLRAEYARLGPGGPAVLGSRVLGEADEPGQDVSSAAWRSVDLGGGPPGADLVRLQAVDGRTDNGGWLAFTSPRVSTFVPVDRLLDSGAPTALWWPTALLFPCVRQPQIDDGITEPSAWAVGFGDFPLSMLLDGTWQTGRGGVFGQTLRQASILQLTARFRSGPVSPDGRVQVYRFFEPYASSAFTLRTSSETVSGVSSRPWTPS